MAGGVGSRFWPMSTPDYPKQFIDVMGVGRSLIQLTVDRLKPICPVENMWVVTNEKYIRIVKEQIPDMPVDISRAGGSQYRSMYRLCLLEDPEEASESKHCSDTIRCSGNQYHRVSASIEQGIELYFR